MKDNNDLFDDNIDWEKLEWEARKGLYFNRFNINTTYRGTAGNKPSGYKLKAKRKNGKIS